MSAVETDTTMSMVTDQAVAAAVAALISASGMEAAASGPTPASPADINETDVVLRLSYGDRRALLVISESLAARLVEALGGSGDDPDSAWSTLTDLADAAGNAARERIASHLGGLPEMGRPEPLSGWSEANMAVAQTARVDVTIDGLENAWVIWAASEDLLAGLMDHGPPPAVVDSVEYPELGEGTPASPGADISFLADVTMGVTVELGRTVMSVREVLQLTQGSVVELDRAAGAPVDVLISGSVIARGEVVVIDDQLGVRVLEIIDSSSSITR